METVASYGDRILDQLLPRLLAEPLVTAGISSKVDVCEEAKHHTKLFWYKLYKFIFVTALARHIVQQIQQI